MSWQQAAEVAYCLLPAIVAFKGETLMGYRKPPKTYHIVWDYGDLAGLELRIKSLSVGRMLDLTAVATTAGTNPTGDLENVFGPFADSLIEWNLEDENGRPVPPRLWACVRSLKPEVVTTTGSTSVPTGRCEDHQQDTTACEFDGLRGQDLGFVMKLVMKWMSAMSDVDIPLPGQSNSGGTSPPPSLGLVNASASLAS